MTLRSYLIIMLFLTIMAWGVFMFIIFTTDPYVTNWIGLALFYGSLAIALIGSFSIGGFFVRFILLKKELVFRSVKEAFRQSFLLSSLVITCLFLLSRDLFSWFNAIILTACLTIFEFFLVSYNRN